MRLIPLLFLFASLSASAAFDRAEFDWVMTVKEDGVIVAIRGAVTVYDTVKGSHTFRFKITGSDLKEVLASTRPRAAAREKVREIVKPMYQAWSSAPVRTTSDMGDVPAIDSLE